MINSDMNGWDVIYSYTRKQAIEDGVLIEIDRNLLRTCGIKIPTVFTQTLTSSLFNKKDTVMELVEIVSFLDQIVVDIRERKENTPRLKLTYSDETVIVDIGPDDEGKPCLTIGFPEDF